MQYLREDHAGTLGSSAVTMGAFPALPDKSGSVEGGRRGSIRKGNCAAVAPSGQLVAVEQGRLHYAQI